MLNIINMNGKKWVSAIELHKGLFSNTRYSHFLKNYLIDYTLVSEGNEFVVGQTQSSGSKGGRPVKEYYIHLDYAKEICATVRTPQAREYIKYLIGLESKVEQGLLFSHEQIIYITKLKSVFQYIENCEKATKKHLDTFVADSGVNNKYVFADFHNMRNAALGLEPTELNQRLKEWCVENHRASFNDKMSKNDKLLLLDKYDVLRNGVWDFLKSEKSEWADNVVNLIKAMAKTENMVIYRKNKDDMFRKKELLPNISDNKLLGG
jgi:phage anti-repressor protein